MLLQQHKERSIIRQASIKPKYLGCQHYSLLPGTSSPFEFDVELIVNYWLRCVILLFWSEYRRLRSGCVYRLWFPTVFNVYHIRIEKSVARLEIAYIFSLGVTTMCICPYIWGAWIITWFNIIVYHVERISCVHQAQQSVRAEVRVTGIPLFHQN